MTRAASILLIMTIQIKTETLTLLLLLNVNATLGIHIVLPRLAQVTNGAFP